MRKVEIIIFIILVFSTCFQSCDNDKILPNMVIIYTDDMGYGDLNCQNPDSRIPTPNLDILASEGMRFTNAHSSSGICSPSRFALLTWTYYWRRQHGIVGAFGKPFFRDTDITLPDETMDISNIGYDTKEGEWEFRPGHIKAGAVSDEIISQIDSMATLAASTGFDLPENVSGQMNSYVLLLIMENL
ncbi:MAG: sulfatase-like hydrolase/transferase [Bacteroidales bacterium]|nr:sulfatase-like hydrolase/transferase [Bacteroidales bacterium]